MLNIIMSTTWNTHIYICMDKLKNRKWDFWLGQQSSVDIFYLFYLIFIIICTFSEHKGISSKLCIQEYGFTHCRLTEKCKRKCFSALLSFCLWNLNLLELHIPQIIITRQSLKEPPVCYCWEMPVTVQPLRAMIFVRGQYSTIPECSATVVKDKRVCR